MKPGQAHVVMGVSGCGKSSVARLLAEQTGGLFRDADDFHPPANKAKMAAGIPLTDDDRWGWLKVLNDEMRSLTGDGHAVFLACSALRQVYREKLAEGLNNLRFVYLQGSQECVRRRLEARRDHFMPSSLLESQFAALEEPSGENVVVVSIENPLPEVIAAILPRLH